MRYSKIMLKETIENEKAKLKVSKLVIKDFKKETKKNSKLLMSNNDTILKEKAILKEIYNDAVNQHCTTKFFLWKTLKNILNILILNTIIAGIVSCLIYIIGIRVIYPPHAIQAAILMAIAIESKSLIKIWDYISKARTFFANKKRIISKSYDQKINNQKTIILIKEIERDNIIGELRVLNNLKNVYTKKSKEIKNNINNLKNCNIIRPKILLEKSNNLSTIENIKTA